MLDCNYHILDLPDVMKLQEKYLSLHNIECKFLIFTLNFQTTFLLLATIVIAN